MYEPTEEDVARCETGNGCEFGICDECSNGGRKDNEEQE